MDTLFPFNFLIIWNKYSWIVTAAKQTEKLTKTSISKEEQGQKHLSMANGPGGTDALKDCSGFYQHDLEVIWQAVPQKKRQGSIRKGERNE